MKKALIFLLVMCASVVAHAQKFALVDMEYILSNIPAYERANEQLNQTSKSVSYTHLTLPTILLV